MQEYVLLPPKKTMSLSQHVGSNRNTRDWATKKQAISLENCVMPTCVSERAPRDRPVIPYFPDTFQKAHEALDAAYKYAKRGENASLNNDERLAYWLMASDSAAVAHYLSERHKDHFKESVLCITPDFDTIGDKVASGLYQFRQEIGADPYTVSGEWYFDELLGEAIKHVKTLRTWYEELTPKQSTIPKTVVLPRINAQQSTKRYAPGYAPKSNGPAQTPQSAPQPASSQQAVSVAPEPQYSTSVAAGGN